MLLLAQPASTMPYTPIEATAKTTSTATLMSATSSGIGSSSRPKNVDAAPNGIGANATYAAATEITGAARNSAASAALGRRSSLKISLTMSAIGWSRPARADQVWAHALLHERRDLALGVHHHRRAHLQPEEHDADDAGVNRAVAACTNVRPSPNAPPPVLSLRAIVRRRRRLALHIRLVFRLEPLERRQHRRRRRVAKRAQASCR